MNFKIPLEILKQSFEKIKMQKNEDSICFYVKRHDLFIYGSDINNVMFCKYIPILNKDNDTYFYISLKNIKKIFQMFKYNDYDEVVITSISYNKIKILTLDERNKNNIILDLIIDYNSIIYNINNLISNVDNYIISLKIPNNIMNEIQKKLLPLCRDQREILQAINFKNNRIESTNGKQLGTVNYNTSINDDITIPSNIFEIIKTVKNSEREYNIIQIFDYIVIYMDNRSEFFIIKKYEYKFLDTNSILPTKDKFNHSFEISKEVFKKGLRYTKGMTSKDNQYLYILIKNNNITFATRDVEVMGIAIYQDCLKNINNTDINFTIPYNSILNLLTYLKEDIIDIMAIDNEKGIMINNNLIMPCRNSDCSIIEEYLNKEKNMKCISLTREQILNKNNEEIKEQIENKKNIPFEDWEAAANKYYNELIYVRKQKAELEEKIKKEESINIQYRKQIKEMINNFDNGERKMNKRSKLIKHLIFSSKSYKKLIFEQNKKIAILLKSESQMEESSFENDLINFNKNQFEIIKNSLSKYDLNIYEDKEKFYLCFESEKLEFNNLDNLIKFCYSVSPINFEQNIKAFKQKDDKIVIVDRLSKNDKLLYLKELIDNSLSGGVNYEMALELLRQTSLKLGEVLENKNNLKMRSIV